MKPILNLLVENMSCDDRIFFPGYVDDIPNWLACSTIYVQTSLIDALPRALLEAMNMEIPVIVSDLETLGAVVTHRQTGVVVMRKSAFEISEAIRFLIKNKDFAASLAANAKEFIQENCSIDMMVKRIEAYL